MADYTTSKMLTPDQAIRLHERLAQLGGSQADYMVEFGGTVPDFLRVQSSLAGQNAVEAVLDGYLALTLAADSDKTTITADGVDSTTIRCSDAVISGDTDVDYKVYRQGVLQAMGTAALESNEVVLVLTVDDPGVYEVEIMRQGANPETGSIFITAIGA